MRRVFLACLGPLWFACAGSGHPGSHAGPSEPAPAPPAASSASHPRPLAAAIATRSRYEAGPVFAALGDGRKGAVTGGRRVVITGSKPTVLDAEGVADLGHGHRIPDALGGGFLFVGRHSLRFAERFDGALVSIVAASASPAELVVGVGYRRVFTRVGTAMPELHSLPDGKPMALEPKGITQLFGAPGGYAAALGPKGELWFSAAGGKPWRRLVAPPLDYLRYDGHSIVLDSERDRLRLGPDGKLALRKEEPGLTVASNVDAFQDPFPDFSKPPPESDLTRLLTPLTHAFDADLALLIHEADLLFVDAKTGALREKQAAAFPGMDSCFLLRGGSPSFARCSPALAVFRIDGPGKKPVLERSFRSDPGALVGPTDERAPLTFSGRCDGTKDFARFCLRKSADDWQETSPVPDPEGVLAKLDFIVHVASGREGHPFAFGWTSEHELVIVDGHAKKVRRIAKNALPDWARDAIDWYAMTVDGSTLRFLLASRGRGAAGVLEIRPSDQIVAERLDGRLAARGSRGLFLSRTGTLRETLDAGRSFHDVASPPGGPPGDGELFGCTDTGCELGPWHRVGWGPSVPVPPEG